MKKEYWEKLKDPRWQRKRLEVMEESCFTCHNCQASDTTLHIHHDYYKKNADPWEYETYELRCLCEECHYEAEMVRREIYKVIAACAGQGGNESLYDIYDYVASSAFGPVWAEMTEEQRAQWWEVRLNESHNGK
jgi:hypothetical protein